jgi:hypothetical protein
MAKLTDLISRVSAVTGVPIATVREAARRLREGNLINTGKRGRYGGAEMTPEDAATLLTALLIVRASCVSLSEIVRLTRGHLNFRSYSSRGDHLSFDSWSRELAVPQLNGLKKGHTFAASLAALLRSIMEGDLERAIAHWASARHRSTAHYFRFSVAINGPRPYSEARIEFDTAAFKQSLTYLHPRDVKRFSIVQPDAPRKLRDLSEEPEFDLIVTASVEESTLTAIGRLLGKPLERALHLT